MLKELKQEECLDLYVGLYKNKVTIEEIQQTWNQIESWWDNENIFLRDKARRMDCCRYNLI